MHALRVFINEKRSNKQGLGKTVRHELSDGLAVGKAAKAGGEQQNVKNTNPTTTASKEGGKLRAMVREDPRWRKQRMTSTAVAGWGIFFLAPRSRDIGAAKGNQGATTEVNMRRCESVHGCSEGEATGRGGKEPPVRPHRKGARVGTVIDAGAKEQQASGDP